MATCRPLSETEMTRVSAGLSLASQLLGRDLPADAEGVQVLFDALLSDPTRPARAVEALGFAFGQLFLRQNWLNWAMLLDDEFGDQIGIAVRDRQLGCSPLSMIKNRLDDGEAWNLSELCDATVQRLRQLGQRAASP
jgi:hypothetical protein